MPVMNRTDFANGLEQGMNTYFGMSYRSFPEEWRKIYEVSNTEKATEFDVLLTGTGPAQVKAEGASAFMDSGGEAWTARYVMETVAIQIGITEEAIEDNLYISLGQKYAKWVARSMQHTKEVKAAAILNNGFTTFKSGDDVELFSTAHTLAKGGTASNKLATPADFMESSLEDILIQNRRMVDDAGIPVSNMPVRVILAPEQEYEACRILDSQMRVGTSDNDVNAVKYKGIFTQPPHIMTRLTAAKAWFVQTDCPDGLKHFNRKSIMTRVKTEHSTGNYLYLARERYDFGATDWRGILGSEGT